jgi:NAD(P)-dependent dehydrogenase (short-subunit alcohol dehydrogenase family)
VAVDGRHFEAVDRFFDRAAELGGELRGVVNCAGPLLLKPAHLTTRSDYDEVLAANLTTAFATVRAGAHVLRRTGGSIVLVSSAAATIGLPNHEAIAAAKAAVADLTRSAAASYAPRQLRLNAVAPGLVATPMASRIVDNKGPLPARSSFTRWLAPANRTRSPTSSLGFWDRRAAGSLVRCGASTVAWHL